MRHGRPRKLTLMLLSIALVISLAACAKGNNTGSVNDGNGGNSENAASSSANEGNTDTAAAPAEKVKLTIYQPDAFKVPGVQNDPVAKEIERITGVTMDIQNPDDQKFKVMMAGGDLPDIIMVPSEHIKQLVEGNNVIPLDELVQQAGPDIQKNVPQRLEYSKQYLSNGTNTLYFLPSLAGPDPKSMKYGGQWVRWDYYKELGYPEIKNLDDLLNVLVDMQKKHPKTDEGKPVYGVSGFIDWGLWPLGGPSLNQGYAQMGYAGQMEYGVDGTARSMITTEDSTFWQSVDFFHKAHAAKILDPEAFTQKFDNYRAKGNNGQILYSNYDWVFNELNQKLNAAGKTDAGMMPLYGFEPYVSYGWDQPVGQANRAIAITKNCKNPEAAMRLINFMFSEEGTRLIFNGIKDKDWTEKDGKAALTDEVVEAMANDPDFSDKTGINKYHKFAGFNFGAKDANGQPYALKYEPEMFAKQMLPIDKDYADHYQVQYPGQYADKLVEEGKAKPAFFNGLISGLLPQPPDDIKMIDGKIDEYMKQNVAKIVLAKDDAEYAAKKKEFIDDINKLGYDKSFAFWSKAWADAKTAGESFK